MGKMEWRQKLRVYDSDDVYFNLLVFNGILDLSKFIKTINKRDLYEELSREKLRQPYLQLIAVHHIMTGPERYTDDQISPILEPLNKFDLQDQWVCYAVRVMFEDNTPEEAYDVIHSVYGRFQDMMDSLLLSYSIVLLEDTVMPYRHHRPDEQEMKNVLSLVKVVIVGIGKTNGITLSKLCDSFHNYTKSQSYSIHYSIINYIGTITYPCFDTFMWILLVIYHELFKQQLSLPGADAKLNDIREWIVAIKDKYWQKNEAASLYFKTYFDLQVTSFDQCMSIINDMFSFNPSLLRIMKRKFLANFCVPGKQVKEVIYYMLMYYNINFSDRTINLITQDFEAILCWAKTLQFYWKEMDLATLILQLNKTKVKNISKEALTVLLARYLPIKKNIGYQGILSRCFKYVRLHNKMDHGNDDLIHKYQEQFPFIATMEQLEKLRRIIVLLILLLTSSALSLKSSQLKKYLALKYEYEDCLLYLLWCSGDVEINPGPTLKKLKKVPVSQKERSWIYDMSTIVLKTIHGHDLAVKTDGLWKEPPQNWDTRQQFYDPRNKPRGSNYSSKDDILLLQNLLEFLNQAGKQLPQPLEEEVMLWRNENKQELLKHYVLRTEKKVITKAMGVLSLYSDDKSLKDQLKEKEIDIVLPGQAGSNTTIKNYPDVVRDIATTLCRVSKRLPITEKSDGIWKSPPPGWNSQDKYYSPCNAGKRNETYQDKQFVDNLINCCECQKIEIPSELQPMVKAWKGGNRDKIYKEYTIWANVCITEHSLKYLEVEGLLDNPQVQQHLQEIGISKSTDTNQAGPLTQNDQPAIKKRKRNTTVTVHEGPKKKSAISNTVIALPACDKGHETSCDPTTTQTPNKNKDDETDNGLPADTTLVSHSANDKTQTNPNNLFDDDKNTNLGNQSRTRINDGSRLPSEVNSGRNLDGSAVPHDNTGSSDGAQVVMDTVDTSENVTMDTSEQDAMDTEDPDRLQKELDDLNDNPPPDLDFVEKYLTLLRNCDSCNNEFDLLTEVPSKKIMLI